MPRHLKQITICGFGLIGGCMALDFQKGRAGTAPKIVAFDRPSVLKKLAKDNSYKVTVEPSLSKSVTNSDIIILSAPHGANEAILTKLSKIKNISDTLILDTGAVKSPISKLARELKFSNGTQFLPTHPMAGRERKGFENAADRLFNDHVWYLDETVELTKTNQTRLEWMIKKLGVTPAFINCEFHDELVSEISHLPQLISTILGAQIDKELIPLAGPGLRSMLRLSGSPYSVWNEIIDQNREEIVKSLTVYKDNLEAVIKLIEKDKSLKEIFADAIRSYKCLS